jgi:hypothetical protein
MSFLHISRTHVLTAVLVTLSPEKCTWGSPYPLCRPSWRFQSYAESEDLFLPNWRRLMVTEDGVAECVLLCLFWVFQYCFMYWNHIVSEMGLFPSSGDRKKKIGILLGSSVQLLSTLNSAKLDRRYQQNRYLYPVTWRRKQNPCSKHCGFIRLNNG